MKRWAICVLWAVLVLVVQGARAQSDLPPNWCNESSSVILRQYAAFDGVIRTMSVGASESGVRSVYQPYNRSLVLISSEPRALLLTIEGNLDLSSFLPYGFSPDCGRLFAQIVENGVFSFTAWDIAAPAPYRLGQIDSAVNAPNVIFSSDFRYAIVTTSQGVYLWQFDSNNIIHVSAEVRSDCEGWVVGCGGRIEAFREVRWDLPGGLVQLDLVSNYTVTLSLTDASVVRVEQQRGTVTSEEEQTVETRLDSTYGCRPRVQYQTYNSRLVLRDWMTNELVSVIQADMPLSDFRFIGWSRTCRYLAAVIEDNAGRRLSIWNMETKGRLEMPLAGDVSHGFRWSEVGEVIAVANDGVGYLLDLNRPEIRTPIFGRANATDAQHDRVLYIAPEHPTSLNAYYVATGEVGSVYPFVDATRAVWIYAYSDQLTVESSEPTGTCRQRSIYRRYSLTTGEIVSEETRDNTAGCR